MATAAPMISVRDYQMKFGTNTVIRDLSFDVQPGETFAFLGSNGSGKTTTIRTLLGIYQPTAGSLLIQGKSYTPEMSGLLGYLPEERGLYKKETVLETMIFFGQLKRMTKEAARKWSLAYLERVELTDKINLPLEKLSGGQQQKVQLGVTIMNDPALMILDEPTKGFDPVNRRLLMDIVEEHSKRGATVVLVTHQMEEVERLCDRVMLLKDGQRRLYGTVNDIRSQYGSDAIDLEFEGTLPPHAKLYDIRKAGRHSAELTPRAGVAAQQILAALVAHPGLKLSKFQVRQASLDDIFISIYSEQSAVGVAQ
jgi:ABC-2 type transport system ATP-binding protein